MLRPSSAAFLATFSLLACSSNTDAPATTDGGTDTGASDAAKDTTPLGDGAACDEPDQVFVKNATGKATDTTGKALVGKPVSVCGSICFFAKTTADGSFDAAINTCLKPDTFSISVHGRPDASLYQRVPALTGASWILKDPLRVPTLPADGPDLPVDAKGVVTAKSTITSAGVSLTFEAGTVVELDIEDVDLGALGNKLRVAKVETKDYPPFTTGENVLALYAANPFDAKFSKGKVGVSFAAPAGLAAGAAVEFVSLGNTFLSAPFDAGKLIVVGTGKVSADGKTVSTDAGVGLTALTWVGVRAAK
ncbi:MAG: hypothetical protein IPJ34_43905 [Myxococcales bacterium]|nr:hypothetical protein [Myxococcales bacterium]